LQNVPPVERAYRSLIGGGVIKPSNVHHTGMGRANGSAATVGGGAGGAAIGRDVADRQRLATVFNGGDGGFQNGHGCRVAPVTSGRQGRRRDAGGAMAAGISGPR
jgi:hypothetical protein